MSAQLGFFMLGHLGGMREIRDAVNIRFDPDSASEKTAAVDDK